MDVLGAGEMEITTASALMTHNGNPTSRKFFPELNVSITIPSKANFHQATSPPSTQTLPSKARN
jgi:hypothetical protein